MTEIKQEMKFYLTIQQLMNVLLNSGGNIAGLWLNLAVDDQAQVWVAVTASDGSDSALTGGGPTEGAIPTPPGSHGLTKNLTNDTKAQAFNDALLKLKQSL